MTDSANIFDQYAAEYEEKFNRNPLGRYQREAVQDIIQSVTPGNSTLLDIGCGPGSDFNFYLSLNLKVSAIEISPQMIEIARRRASSLGLQADIRRASLETFQTSQRYDTIVLNFGVINMISDLDSAMQKLENMLRQGGHLLIVSMPPLHLFSIAGYLGSAWFRIAYRRIIQKRAILDNGLRFYYYRRPDFRSGLQMLLSKSMAPLLPNPDQYQRWAWCRTITHLLMPLDRKVSGIWPDILGGDHICYLFRKAE